MKTSDRPNRKNRYAQHTSLLQMIKTLRLQLNNGNKIGFQIMDCSKVLNLRL